VLGPGRVTGLEPDRQRRQAILADRRPVRQGLIDYRNAVTGWGR
jgi:hypothetical protein